MAKRVDDEPTRRVDGGGAGSCDVCHGRLDFSWQVVNDAGEYSVRCSTHLSASFDRAAVWR
jgi:hypothetical protein